MYLTKEEREEKIRKLAYNWYEIRMKYGVAGTPEGDWSKAEAIVDSDYPYKIKEVV